MWEQGSEVTRFGSKGQRSLGLGAGVRGHRCFCSPGSVGSAEEQLWSPVPHEGRSDCQVNHAPFTYTTVPSANIVSRAVLQYNCTRVAVLLQNQYCSTSCVAVPQYNCSISRVVVLHYKYTSSNVAAQLQDYSTSSTTVPVG